LFFLSLCLLEKKQEGEGKSLTPDRSSFGYIFHCIR
jgi:hypothetical protein